MEKWTFKNYREPYLAAANIRLDGESGDLLIQAEGSSAEYVIEHDGGSGEAILADLKDLQTPGHARWKELDDVSNDAAWFGLLEQMDYLGLVRDADWRSPATSEVERLEALAKETCAKLLGMVSDASQQGQLADNVVYVRDFVARLVQSLAAEVLPDQPEAGMVPTSRAALHGDGFYLQTLLLQALYWRRSAPLSLTVALRALDLAAAELGRPTSPQQEACAALLEELSGSVFSTRDVRAQVQCVSNFVGRSVGADARRRCHNAYTPTGRLSGLAFMAEVERHTDLAMEDIGTPRFIDAIEQPSAPIELAQGCYLEEYHVTCRFVEMMTPMMAKRLRAPLRTRMTRYYAEEVGHEAFEMETCKSLGLEEAEITAREPLPLHVAYVDVFTLVSEVDPIGCFASLFITEGVLGKTSPVDGPMKRITGSGEAFEEVAGAHSALNEEYNHTSLSRLFMADVPSVGPAAQAMAMEHMLLMLELNCRCWDDVLEHYGPNGPWQSRRAKASA